MREGVRSILQTIVDEMGTCSGGKCDDHAIRFGREALDAARAALDEADADAAKVAAFIAHHEPKNL